MDGTGQGCAIAVLDGPSVGTFFPGRAAKLLLAVFGRFAALMFRPLGCLCVHCQEATFALFYMRVGRVFGPKHRTLVRSLLIFISLEWTGLFNFSSCLDSYSFNICGLPLSFESPAHLITCCFSLLQSLIMMLSRREDATRYGQAISPHSRAFPEWEHYSCSLLLFDPRRWTVTMQHAHHFGQCPQLL